MPTYEYQCQACGHQMEAVQRITEDALKDCPECKKPTLERLISSGNFLLKGSGWYKDGYGSSTGRKPRTENDRIDKLTKTIEEDKKKTSEAAAASADASSGGETSGSTSGSGSDSSSGGAAPSTPSTTSS